jgi:hypothetical protein
LHSELAIICYYNNGSIIYNEDVLVDSDTGAGAGAGAGAADDVDVDIDVALGVFQPDLYL